MSNVIGLFEKEAVLFMNEMNELVQRLALNIGGHDVQILCFDGNQDCMMVKVDKSINIMPIEKVDAFIRARL